MEKIITFAQFRSEDEADDARSFLMEKGIDCKVVELITNDVAGGHYNKILSKIEIPEEHLTDALDMMNEEGIDNFVLEHIRII